MPQWFDQHGRDMRTLDEQEREETAGHAFRRLFLSAFIIAAIIGLLIGIVWTIAGVWHFHGSRLF
jgi:predicted PurR-regulated permease PerM